VEVQLAVLLGPATKGRFEVDKGLLGWIETAYGGPG